MMKILASMDKPMDFNNNIGNEKINHTDDKEAPLRNDTSTFMDLQSFVQENMTEFSFHNHGETILSHNYLKDVRILLQEPENFSQNLGEKSECHSGQVILNLSQDNTDYKTEMYTNPNIHSLTKFPQFDSDPILINVDQNSVEKQDFPPLNTSLFHTCWSQTSVPQQLSALNTDHSFLSFNQNLLHKQDVFIAVNNLTNTIQGNKQEFPKIYEGQRQTNIFLGNSATCINDQSLSHLNNQGQSSIYEERYSKEDYFKSNEGQCQTNLNRLNTDKGKIHPLYKCQGQINLNQQFNNMEMCQLNNGHGQKHWSQFSHDKEEFHPFNDSLGQINLNQDINQREMFLLNDGQANLRRDFIDEVNKSQFNSVTVEANLCVQNGKKVQSLPVNNCLRRFFCEECHMTFKENGALQNHLRIHTGEKPFLCEICPKTFRTRSSLNEHHRTHDEKRPKFLCTICDKILTSAPGLIKHVKSHNGVKNFKCEFCDKSFSTASHQKRHIKIHTKEKPHKCDTCGETFNQKGNLKIHASRKHEEDRVRAFSCDKCERKFLHKWTLKMHLKKCGMDGRKPNPP